MLVSRGSSECRQDTVDEAEPTRSNSLNPKPIMIERSIPLDVEDNIKIILNEIATAGTFHVDRADQEKPVPMRSSIVDAFSQLKNSLKTVSQTAVATLQNVPKSNSNTSSESRIFLEDVYNVLLSLD